MAELIDLGHTVGKLDSRKYSLTLLQEEYCGEGIYVPPAQVTIIGVDVLKRLRGAIDKMLEERAQAIKEREEY